MNYKLLYTMRCFKCGLLKSGPYDPNFECEDCKTFTPILMDIWSDVNSKFDTLEVYDPEAHEALRLLADTTFVTATNPQIRIFYRVCETLVAEALNGSTEITDSQLAKRVRTTRGFSDVFRIFSDLDLISVRNRMYHRVLVFREKLLRMASQYLAESRVSNQISKRLAHIYASYVLLYILYQVAKMKDDGGVANLPYGKRPQSLWVVLMFLWSTAYNQEKSFKYEDMRKFLAKRGLTSSAANVIAGRLQTVDGKTTQGMIRNFAIEDDDGLVFTFEDYVIREFVRIRSLERER